MLNVPETVKALFKADGVRKNFRVQFPNGELPDITNDNIVQESVKFTESLCTQDVLKFGLTEASVIEFETVGVANMYGMTIECGIEIDLSSLSASEIAEIAAGSWDGVYVSETDTDIGFPFFRVPYGVFRVESCPRDHQAMTHRKVQAYNNIVARVSRNSPFELAKLRLVSHDSGTYSPDIKKLITAGLGWYNAEALADYTKTQLAPWQSWPPSATSKGFIWANSVNITSYWNVSNMKAATIVFDPAEGANFPADCLYGLTFNGGALFDSAMASIDEFCATYNVPDKAKQFIKNYVRPNIMYNGQQASNQRELTPQKIAFSGDLPVFYPKGADGKTIVMTIISDVTISWFTGGSGRPYTSNSLTLHLLDAEPTLYKYTDGSTALTASISNTSDLSSYSMQLSVTSSGQYSYQITILSMTKANFYTFVDAYDFMALLNGVTELNAQFGKVNRDNNFALLRLSTASPVPVVPGEYSGFWWDEYDVLPIGSVQYSFTDAGKKENVIIYEFGPGESTYDMTRNEALSIIEGVTEDYVNTLLNESFIPHLGPIAFTPIDLDMKGLPYVEPGDYLAVTAEDGQTAYSFNMRQEISGVQVLDAHIESTSGTIIESEAGT